MTGRNAPATLAVVSILIQPEGRMQHTLRHTYATRFIVSILIQPEGRMQRGPRAARMRESVRVSILIQPEGRMQHAPYPLITSIVHRFQSSSSPKAGCNNQLSRVQLPVFLFQSSSSPKAGCNGASGTCAPWG